MAHHSSQPDDPAIRDLWSKLFREREPQLGPTGQFPQGKLTPTDEGEIRIGITHYDGKVIIDFGRPTAWIGFDPDQADQIAETIREHAAKVRQD